jgi:hypothetical protein
MLEKGNIVKVAIDIGKERVVHNLVGAMTNPAFIGKYFL